MPDLTKQELTEALDKAEGQLSEQVRLNEELKARLDDLEAQAAAAKAAQEEAAKPPPPEPPRKRVRYRCVRRCFHSLSADRPDTKRLYEPGDAYLAYEKEDVPRHFVVDDGSAEAIIGAAQAQRLPPHLARKQQNAI